MRYDDVEIDFDDNQPMRKASSPRIMELESILRLCH